MRQNTKDETIVRNYLQKYKFLIKEYEEVKNKTHPKYRFAKDFYEANSVDRRSFAKYYNRFKQSGRKEELLLPQKRGPKYKTRRPLPFIENKVIEQRKKGNNRYEIVSILKPKLRRFTPSPSGVYNILKRHNLNTMNKKIKEARRKIIKKKAGELGHVDAHYLSRTIQFKKGERFYLVGLIDDYSRIAWCELVKDIKSLTVMFATMKSFMVLKDQYGIEFKELLSDNGSEFGSKRRKDKSIHPFERMLIELDVKHRYTRPYRPQTNGKIERFWRTIEDDLLRDTTFEFEEQLRDELMQYLYYYNHMRPHQGLDSKVPVEMVGLNSTSEEDLLTPADSL